jgi:glycosyltransferase involved in cell wall biosynthesis
MEVIVVDNGSTEDSKNVAQSFDFVTLLEEPDAGSYAARNRGLSCVKGDYVAFTDSDCEA